MRDLYRLLSVNATSTLQVLEQAIANTSDRDLASDARWVLTNESRKRRYDIHRAQLRLIGELRANLHLVDKALWSECDTSHFNIQPTQSQTATSRLSATLKARHADTPVSGRNAGRDWTIGPRTLIVLGLVVWILYLMSSADILRRDIASPLTTDSSPTPLRQPNGQPNLPTAPYPALPMPATGVLWQRFRSLREGAPFRIVTAQGEASYFIKIINVRTSRPVVTGLIRGGEKLDTLLPPGRYELRYATGTSWYGTENLFGPATSYHRADEEFLLSETADGFQGVTIELILQQSGNLRTMPIDASGF